jgi:hypothetical protein
MDAATRDLVRRRANDRCEYCQFPQDHSELTHHIEHIIAKQHGGSDEAENLALACHRCNLQKGPNLTGIDPVSGEVVLLFHPRRDEWHDHFRLRGAYIEGVTRIGRATVQVFAMNAARRLELRSELIERLKLP